MTSIPRDDFAFRGSLGHEKRGHREFAEYVDMVHADLDECRCGIQDLVETDGKAVARIRIEDVHDGPFPGFPAMGKHVPWNGCAFFTRRKGRASDLWVLGVLQGLQELRTPDGVADLSRNDRTASPEPNKPGWFIAHEFHPGLPQPQGRGSWTVSCSHPIEEL